MKSVEPAITLAGLKGSRLDRLEQIYLESEPAKLGDGLHKGHFLGMLDSVDAGKPGLWLISNGGFNWTPFWIDFSKNLWCFWHPKVALGKFETTLGPSRWRETRTYQLHYGCSHLPGFVKRHLYDEVKPINETICLGIGGVNAPGNKGDLFFFALERVA
jgi:hypothetical protein